MQLEYVIKIQGSRDVAQCKHETRLECIKREIFQPREAAVSKRWFAWDCCTLVDSPIVVYTIFVLSPM